MGNTNRVPVVTAFVQQGDRIALIKRSQDVGTYKGAWAAFSGYMERLPLNQAWLELWEEAGVNENQVELRGIGVPVAVDDPKEGHSWLILPFLFRLLPGVEVKTDWEAEELAWVQPGDLATMDTVPGLETALKHVWPPFGDHEFWEGLAHVATNTDDGATELARRGLEVLGGLVQAHDNHMDRTELLQAIRAFASARPSIGVFADLAARLLLAIQSTGGQYDMDELIDEMLGMVEDATDLCVNEAAQGLRGRRKVFTLSYSETVADALVTWHTGDAEVLVAESLPRREGVALVDYLAENGVNAVIIPDGDIVAAVKTADAVFVGCDAITGDDCILNKAGTREVAQAAREAGIPAYAVAQTFKIAPPDWPVLLERQAPSDYDETSTEYVGPEFFDTTPLGCFEAVFTEEGILTRERLTELRSELGSVELMPGA